MGSVFGEIQPKVQEGWEAFKSLPVLTKAVIATGSVLTSSFLCAAALESLLRVRDRKKFPPRGKIYPTATGKMHVIYKEGPKDDETEYRPTVLLDAGVGCWSLIYADLLDELSTAANVVAFDRFGYGYSSYKGKGNRVVDAANSLTQILQRLHLEGPYIYVAHSLSGTFANYYAHKNKDKIVGIIYLDAMNKRAAQSMHRIRPNAHKKPLVNFGYKLLSYIGVLRLMTYFGKLPLVRAYPKELRSEVAATTTKWEWLASVELDRRGTAEAYGLTDSSTALIKEEDGWLDDLPITVVLPDYLTTQGTTKKIQRELILEAIEAVKATTKFSSNAKMVDVEDCSHWIMWDRPKVIVDETMEMIKRADQHRKQSWGF